MSDREERALERSVYPEDRHKLRRIRCARGIHEWRDGTLFRDKGFWAWEARDCLGENCGATDRRPLPRYKEIPRPRRPLRDDHFRDRLYPTPRLPAPWDRRATLSVWEDREMLETVLRAESWAPDTYGKWVGFGAEVRISLREAHITRNPAGLMRHALHQLALRLDAAPVDRFRAQRHKPFKNRPKLEPTWLNETTARASYGRCGCPLADGVVSEHRGDCPLARI